MYVEFGEVVDDCLYEEVVGVDCVDDEEVVVECCD